MRLFQLGRWLLGWWKFIWLYKPIKNPTLNSEAFKQNLFISLCD